MRRAALCGASGLALVVLSSSRWDASGAPSLPSTPLAAPASVVVAAADIPAGSTVSPSMLTTATLAAGATHGLLADAGAVVGRVLLVPLVQGEPLAFGMTAARPTAAADHRLVRVSLSAIDVAPDVAVGAQADVVASYPPSTAEARPAVDVVASARVVSLDERSDGAAAPSPPQPPAAAGTETPVDAPAVIVTLDCSAADALRVLWARDNARVLRLLGHPAGGGPLPGEVTAP